MKTTPILIRLTPELKTKIQKIAQTRGVSMNALIAQLLYVFAEKEKA